MSIGCSVNDFSIPDPHRGMGDLVGPGSEKQQVAGSQILPSDAACRSASCGMLMPRLRTSIGVKPEQS